MKNISFVLIFILFPALSFAADGITALQKMGKKDVMEWKNFQFKRNFEDSGEVVIQVLYKGKKLKEYSGTTNDAGPDFDRDWTYLDLYQLLPGPDVQALVYCSGGGKDHNGNYFILNLNEDGSVRELFDSDRYLLEGYFDFLKCKKSKFLAIEDAESTGWEQGASGLLEERKVQRTFVYDELKKEYVSSNCGQ